MEHSQVVLGLLGLAYEQMAEAVEPRVGSLYDPTGTAPAAGFLARFLRLDFFASWANRRLLSVPGRSRCPHPGTDPARAR